MAEVAVAGEDVLVALYAVYAVHYVTAVVAEEHDIASFEIFLLCGGEGCYAHLRTVAAHKGTHAVTLYADDYALIFGEELLNVGEEYIVADALHRVMGLFAAKYGVVRELSGGCIGQTLQMVYRHLHQHLGEGSADVILQLAVVCERGRAGG